MNIIKESEKLCPPEYLGRNYQKELDRLLESIVIESGVDQQKSPPSLLLHSCCAPCSSYCISYLSNYFKTTVFYFNPNITEAEEYQRRVREQKRFIEEFSKKNAKYPVSFLEGDYDIDLFYNISKGLESAPEGGLRCAKCYLLRLEETAKKAAQLSFDYFTTTLTISPQKHSGLLNAIGEKAGNTLGVKYLLSDFKKNGGYKKSVELSNEYGLYRQDYCGCVFSKR